MKQDSSSKNFKKHGIKPLALPARRVGEWEKARKNRRATPGSPKSKKTIFKMGQLTEEEVEMMARKKAGGMSYPDIAREHSVSQRMVEIAVRRKFIHDGKGREVLKGVLLEGAISAGQQATDKIPELNGMQSVIATGILTQRFIDIDKHTQNMPASEADIAKIASVANFIEELARDVGIDDPVIDVEAEVTHEES